MSTYTVWQYPSPDIRRYFEILNDPDVKDIEDLDKMASLVVMREGCYGTPTSMSGWEPQARFLLQDGVLTPHPVGK
jgi:hypothetical protein